MGIGNGSEFKEFKKLDADINPVFSNKLKEYQSRDIVQFVAYKDHMKNPMSLAEAVLWEIPDQLTSYYKFKGAQSMKGAKSKDEGKRQ